MKKRSIVRGAFLQNYEGKEEKLYPLIGEVADKGYRMVYFSGLDDMSRMHRLCTMAHERGLEVGVFTGYMKYDYAFIAEHPELSMISARDTLDQDGLSMRTWGCPWQPAMKKRYYDKLREIATYPGIVHIDLNDEAMLADGCYCTVCREAYDHEFGGEIPCHPDPEPEHWEDPEWRGYMAWRIRRWTDLHAEMAEVIREVNPDIKVCFQASPASDMWNNPWFTAIDLAGMAESLDRISTNPYYTFHLRIFDPAEVYLSEWSRFLYGILPEGKEAVIVQQGFAHPTFTRPMNESDGVWAAVVPPACGVNVASPYTYALQKCIPMQKPYEATWKKLDPAFETVEPLCHIGVVHGLRTEVMQVPVPAAYPFNYDATRMFPVAASLRQAGIPYGFLADAALADAGRMAKFNALALPQIGCLSGGERAGLRAYLEGGGNAAIFGDLGDADETGAATPSLLAELFGIELGAAMDGEVQVFEPDPACPGLGLVKQPDPEMARRYWEGANAPLFALSICRAATLPGDARVLATFDADGNHPAIVSLERHGGRVVWFAGFPSRTTQHPKFNTWVRNLGHQLVGRLVDWVAGEAPALRVEEWPPATPMDEVRPLDHRFMATHEFIPSRGEDRFLGVITSYFREPAQYPMVLNVPAGRKLSKVTELMSGQTVPHIMDGDEARITVKVTYDTAALVYCFELGR
jgi:hypothetical protein